MIYILLWIRPFQRWSWHQSVAPDRCLEFLGWTWWTSFEKQKSCCRCDGSPKQQNIKNWRLIKLLIKKICKKFQIFKNPPIYCRNNSMPSAPTMLKTTPTKGYGLSDRWKDMDTTNFHYTQNDKIKKLVSFNVGPPKEDIFLTTIYDLCFSHHYTYMLTL